jgi:multidrug resistance efflux pump
MEVEMRSLNLRRMIPLIFMLLVVIAGSIYLISVSGPPDGPLQASGIVEAVEVLVAPEIGGRVTEVRVEEGLLVEAGQELFRLDDAMILAQRDQAQAAVATTQAALSTAQSAVEAAQVQLEIALAQARASEISGPLDPWRQFPPGAFDLPMWYFQQDELIQAAQREMEAAEQALADERQAASGVLESEVGAALHDAESRLARALEAYFVARQVLDRANLAWTNQALRDAAQDLFDEAEARLEQEQQAYDDLFSADQADEILEARARLAAAQARYDLALAQYDSLLTGEFSLAVRAARAGLEQAQAMQTQAQAAVTLAEAEFAVLEMQLEKLVISAPSAGLVLTRSIEPGEVLQPGAGAITLSLIDDLRITVFIPEDRYGEVSLGAAVEISVDSFPDEVFSGSVLRIADRAEFTPRNVQTEEGRRSTVFAVEISVSDPRGMLKPGMPADVKF